MFPVITLTTDFGDTDPFVGIMKGVILAICPDVHLVDLVHGIEPQDVRQAARVIGDSWKYFPQGTIHVGVVDPGVGTTRRAIAVEAGGHAFVGPDNGVFSRVLAGRTGEFRAVSVENPSYLLPGISRSFHGRDIFAPAAAWLARGTPLHKLGPDLSELLMLEEESPRIVYGEQVRGTIIGFDRFGNAETNITGNDILAAFNSESTESLCLSVRGTGPLFLMGTYGEAAETDVAALMNSAERLEVFIYKGSVREELGLVVGDEVTVFPDNRQDSRAWGSGRPRPS